MDVYEKTVIKIEFAKGIELTPIIVYEGVELKTKTFSNKTHQIEELLDFIAYTEYSGCDVYL